MPYEFESVGWEDESGERWAGRPDASDLGDTYGILVHAYDPETGEHEYFWSFIPEPFESWDDWWDYISDLMDMYGMASA